MSLLILPNDTVKEQPRRLCKVKPEWVDVYCPSFKTIPLLNAIYVTGKSTSIQPITTNISPAKTEWRKDVVVSGKPFTLLVSGYLGSGIHGIVAQRNASSWTLCCYNSIIDFYTGGSFLSGTKPPAFVKAWRNIVITTDGTNNGYIIENGIVYPVSGFSSIVSPTYSTEFLSWDNGGYVDIDSKLTLAASSNKFFGIERAKELTRNPWQIFEPDIVPFYFNTSGTPTTTASGSLAALNLIAPNVTTVQISIASSSLAALSLSAPNVTATTTSTIIASGSFTALSLSTPTVTSVQTSIASGSLASISLSAPACTVSTVSAITASGSLAALSLSAPNATTVQTSIASGAVPVLSLSAPTGTVSTVASVIASGNIVAININAPAVQAVLSVKGSGYFSPITLVAPNHVLAPSTTVPEIVNFDTMIQREVSFDTLITRTVSYTVER